MASDTKATRMRLVASAIAPARRSVRAQRPAFRQQRGKFAVHKASHRFFDVMQGFPTFQHRAFAPARLAARRPANCFGKVPEWNPGRNRPTTDSPWLPTITGASPSGRFAS